MINHFNSTTGRALRGRAASRRPSVGLATLHSRERKVENPPAFDFRWLPGVIDHLSEPLTRFPE
jgi:hypothetical protein